jgi:hypothetical protein
MVFRALSIAFFILREREREQSISLCLRSLKSKVSARLGMFVTERGDTDPRKKIEGQ